MEQMTLNEMKGSQIHRIVAAVLDIMEQAGFDTSVDVSLKESKEPEIWMMTFEKNSTSLDELTGIKQKLGADFQISILAKAKDKLSIKLEAKSDDFLNLLKKQIV